MRKIRVIFVCTGNVCRSPMAEAVFAHLVDEADLGEHFEISSAGTDSWHAGERPHRGTQLVLKQHHIPLRPEKVARQIGLAEVRNYDYVVAMDQSHVEDLRGAGGNVRRLLEYCPNRSGLNVPDPYYSGGFEEVCELVTKGCKCLLETIRQKEGL
jgi:protein-tyrosine phosphatase